MAITGVSTQNPLNERNGDVYANQCTTGVNSGWFFTELLMEFRCACLDTPGLGVRSSNLKSAAHFFGAVLGLAVCYRDKGIVQFELPSGQLFEVFGSESRFYPLHGCPVLAFQVEDVKTARTELVSKGVAFVTDVEG